jgi:hypothetical protein
VIKIEEKKVKFKRNDELTNEERLIRNKIAKEKYKKNKEKILERRKELYYSKHQEKKYNYYHTPEIKEKRSKYSLEYYNKNRDNYLANYYLNKDKINQKASIMVKKKYHSDPQFKVKTILRCRLNNTLKWDYEDPYIVDLLGISIKEFKVYLESKFQEDMCWSNRVLWHIDHINPLKNFDLTKISDLKKCYHYTNLQPLWCKQNLNKGANGN